MTNEGFLLDLHTSMLFFRYCRRYKLDGKEERIAVLRRIVGKKKATYIRDPEKFLENKHVARIERRPHGNQ